MVTFQQVQSSRLYVSTSNPSVGGGWWGFQLSQGAVIPGGSIGLDKALNDNQLDGTFVYLVSAPDLADRSKVDAFIAKIQAILDTIIGTRAMIFLPTGDTASITPDNALKVPLAHSARGVYTNQGITVPLTGSADKPISAQLAAQSWITVSDDGNGLKFDGGQNPAVSLGGLGPSDVYQPDNTGVLSFTQPTLGAFSFGIFIRRLALNNALNWGFQLFAPNQTVSDAQPFAYATAWLPLADGSQPNGEDMLGFTAQINLPNPNNQFAAAATVFLFTGQNSGSSATATTLVSYFRTKGGHIVSLLPIANAASGAIPAGLTINTGYRATPLQVGYHFAPFGDFALSVDKAPQDQPQYLLCGLSGTETIAFLSSPSADSPASRIRFTMNRPGLAPQFPLPASSPVGPPLDATARLMDTTYMTAWVSVLAPTGSPEASLYTAAPKGSDLFAKDTIIAPAQPGLLGPVGPGVQLQPDTVFPLMPYAGFVAGTGTGDQDFKRDQMELFERQIVAPARRNAISATAPKFAASVQHALGLLNAAEDPSCPFYSATPTGFISHVRCDGSWDQMLLAQVTAGQSGPVKLQMGFTLLQRQLQTAFQTSSLFLVVANGKYLGAPKSGTFMPPASGTVYDQNFFFNAIEIGDWVFEARTGQQNAYSDYRDVIVVKGVKGKLTDLVLSPEKWTMKDLFGAPSMKAGMDPDVSQLIPLSNWMNDYLNKALDQKDNPFFTNFCNIIQREDWTGVLILRASINSVPRDLAGITAGVTDPAKFFAHHVGIEIGQIDGATVQQKGSTSLFGLVYYVDPGYRDVQPPLPIPQRNAQDKWGFTLLTLKALFQNTALLKFESLAQITLNQILGSGVSKMGDGGNIYNAILMQGAFQSNGGAPVYSMSSAGTNVYLLANNVLPQITIDSAIMSTRDDGSVSGKVVSWIALAGAMKFALIKDTITQQPSTPLPDIDFFSFDALSFSNLGLRITQAASVPTVDMVESEISFNIASSTPRLLSLYSNFQLELLSLQNGDKDRTPDSLGFLTVGTQYALQGVAGNPWHGLRFKINLGTPGALASKVNLTSTLLLAWTDDSGITGGAGYRALVGISLPGAGSGGDLFSLQTVLKLSVGAIQLYYNTSQKSFLLLLNEIALKFLGLLKVPPNGATAFFLFGNPSATSSTGLGWYAIYNQEQPKSQAPPLVR